MAAAIPDFYQQKLDMQVRYDHRSDQTERSQYRLRFYPRLNFDSQWSLHSFVVTGNGFSSSHNTFGSDNNDKIAVRRLYMRRTYSKGKTEFGVIPTYKGRVSATGLAKDGWFQGLRHVHQIQPDHQLELVVGALDATDPARALAVHGDINLFELEYSATLNHLFSIEAGVEHITNGNYLRGEIRYHQQPEQVWFAEIVRRVDQAENKLVLGLESTFLIQQYPIAFYGYYAYVSTEFGERATLTEDYLGTGHAGSLEFSGNIFAARLDWFARIDMVKNTRRLLVGIKRSF
ncbi:hypothetical protein GCM10011338_31630 [Alteromonas lipolytica]|nr:hypothetical protein GCM10011338_31630 [Alteromonas lipolytica]